MSVYRTMAIDDTHEITEQLKLSSLLCMSFCRRVMSFDVDSVFAPTHQRSQRSLLPRTQHAAAATPGTQLFRGAQSFLVRLFI
jgi:hypothetical protein